MFRSWLLSTVVCVLVVVLSIVYLDRRIAEFTHQFVGVRTLLRNDIFRLPVLPAVGVVLLLWGALFSATGRGTKIAFQAGLAMTGALALNSVLLKPAFGRALPWLYFSHQSYGFHPFHTSALFGSFPSGHSALAAALVSVSWISHPKGRPIYVMAVTALSGALLLGEWHFLSDLIAGLFVGASAGLAAMMFTHAAIARDLQPVPHHLDENVPKWMQSITDLLRKEPPAEKKPLAGSRTKVL